MSRLSALKVTPALLVQGSCGIGKPFGEDGKLAVRIAELLAAVASFGRDPKARLRWLLTFVEPDLSPPGAAERAALGTAIFIFSARVVSPNVHAGAGMSKLDAGMFDTYPLERRAKA